MKSVKPFQSNSAFFFVPRVFRFCVDLPHLLAIFERCLKVEKQCPTQDVVEILLYLVLEGKSLK